MNVVLWILQVLLALAFFAHGWMLLAPPPEIAAQMADTLPRAFQIFLGTAEIAAAAGLTLPGITRILPWLVSWAAAGVVLVMISATVWHVVRGELQAAAITMVLLAMAAVVAWMRYRVVPIAARARARRDAPRA